MVTIEEVQAKLEEAKTALGAVKAAVETDRDTDAATQAADQAALAASEAEKGDLKSQITALADQVVTLTQQLAALPGQGVSQGTIDALMQTALEIATSISDVAGSIPNQAAAAPAARSKR